MHVSFYQKINNNMYASNLFIFVCPSKYLGKFKVCENEKLFSKNYWDLSFKKGGK